jgi:nucleoside-diphosphate-sugar epimerase
MPRKGFALVTGGSGFFGEVLVNCLLKHGWEVRNFDLNLNRNMAENLQIIGNISDPEMCLNAVNRVDTVFHNIAQVPLAKNTKQFQDVNTQGTKNILEAAFKAGVKNFVYTSSSAVYGLPTEMPVTSQSEKTPIEIYGKTKLGGELLCQKYINSGMNIKIVRPRTILGAGRLGIFSILNDWIFNELDIYLIGNGNKPYQFIHAIDLAEAMLRIASLPGDREFNLGALEFKNFKSELSDLCKYAGSNSKIRILPEVPTRLILKLMSKSNILPFAPYQLAMYGKEFYFDSKSVWKELNYKPKYSNIECFTESYDWYKDNLELNYTGPVSQHKSAMTSKILKLIKVLLKVIKRIGR